MADQVVNRSRHRMIYKVKNPQIRLPDIPSHLFDMIASDMKKPFFVNCNSKLFGTYTKANKELAKLSCKEALYRLGDKEQWTVEVLVNKLIESDNRKALQHLLAFWPAHFVKRPPLTVTVEEGDYLEVEVDVAGFPVPLVRWMDDLCRSFGDEGPRLQMEPSRFWSGEFYVSAMNEYKGRPAEEKLLFNVVITPRLYRPPCVQAVDRIVDDAPPIPVNKGREFSATKKVALLIGMTRYHETTLSGLTGPLQDLPYLASKLASIGYEVLSLLDLPLQDVHSAIRIYGDLLRSDGVYGVLYLSGHGVRFQNIDDDFLIPVGAGENASPGEYLSRKKTLIFLQNMNPGFNLVVWDACRSQEERHGSVGGCVYEPVRETVAETNLYHFCSTTAFHKAVELRPQAGGSVDQQRSSLTVMKFLELFKEGQRPIGEMLVRWQKLIIDEKFLVGDREDIQDSVILASANPNKSLWDPVGGGDYLAFATPVVREWNSRPLSACPAVYPSPDIQLTPTLVSHGASLKLHFYMHNVLRLTVHSDSRYPVYIDVQSLTRCLHEELADGRELVESWNCFRVKERGPDTGNLAVSVIFHHVQRFIPVAGSNVLTIPVVLKEHDGTWRSHLCYIKDLYIIRLFTADRTA